MEDRLLELETQAAYQAKLLSELDEVLQDFGGRLGKIERRLRRLEESKSEPQGEMEPHDTRPPHY